MFKISIFNEKIYERISFVIITFLNNKNVFIIVNEKSNINKFYIIFDDSKFIVHLIIKQIFVKLNKRNNEK